MKKLIFIIVAIIASASLSAQTTIKSQEGTISYISGNSVYVKYSSTEHISKNDTLFAANGKAILVVKNKSSISLVCEKLGSFSFNKGDKVFTTEKTIKETKKEKVVAPIAVSSTDVKTEKKQTEQKTNTNRSKQKKDDVYGKLSLSGYSNFSNTPGGNSQRMRYTFAMNADDIANSKISAETYVSFVHNNNNWSDIQGNIFNGLKIYSMAVNYKPVESLKITLGRKINNNLSNLGAIDGLQVEKTWKSIITGVFIGSRPDYQDYSFNFNLMQYGGYVGHVYRNKAKREMKTTIAFAEQKNGGATDRRFAYIQHFNALAKNLYFFGTAEVELYQNVNGEQKSAFNLTNLYFMLRYRALKNLSFSGSYSARTNLIYYETYKDFVDRLLEDQALQGFRLSVNYRPVRKLSINIRAGYRSRADDPRPTKNANVRISYSDIPGIHASATISGTMLETPYMKGQIYGLRLAKDLIRGKVYGSLSYRYVHYDYSYMIGKTTQHVGDVNITWRIIKRLSLALAYEGQFEGSDNYNRVYVNLIKRF